MPLTSEIPDTSLAGPAPLLRAVVGIPEPLVCDRLHGANTWTVASSAPMKWRDPARPALRRH